MRTSLALLALLPLSAGAQRAGGTTSAPPAAIAEIREADLKRDLYLLAGDAMRGREAGTVDELRASVWLAEQMRRIGIKPLGQDSSFFQWWNLRRTRLSASSIVKIGDRSFTLWNDIAATSNNEADVSGTTVWAGDGRDTTIDVRGKIAIVQIAAPATGGRETSVNSPEYRYANRAIQLQGGAMAQRGAIGVILIADETAEKAFDGVKNIRARGTYAIDGSTGRGGARGGAAATPERPFGTGAACGGPPVAVDTTSGRGARGGGGGGGGRAGGGGRGNAGGAPAPRPARPPRDG